MEWGIVSVCLMLIPVSVYDAKKRLIPNEVIALLMVLKLIMVMSECFLLNSSQGFELILISLATSLAQAFVVIACLLLLSLIMEKLLGKPSLGMGDVKLIGVLVLFLTTEQILPFLWLACFAMLLTALFYAVKKKRTFPCAPAIAAGFIAELLFALGF